MPRGLLCLAILLAQLGLLTHPAHAATDSNITIPAGGRVTVELEFSESVWSNTLSITSPNVAVALTGCTLQPAEGLGGVHILSEKLSQRGCRAELDADPDTPGIQGFAANTTLEFGFCAQLDADPQCDYVWSSDKTKNSDAFEHVTVTQISLGGAIGQAWRLEWEDQPSGGDADFNDIVAVVRVAADSDGDGLWDDWELNGIDNTGDGIPDLILPNADPRHKNVYLEVDYMDCAIAGGDCAPGETLSLRPKPAAIQTLVDAFAHAPVNNPDGGKGISLTVDVSNAVARQQLLSLGCGGTSSAGFNAIKENDVYFGLSNPRRFAYHYAILGQRQSITSTSMGCAETPGNDLLVTLGEWNTVCVGAGPDGTLSSVAVGDDIRIEGAGAAVLSGPNLICDTPANKSDTQVVPLGSAPKADLDGDDSDDRRVGTAQQQAAALMHELGHNFGLKHGGSDDHNNKPNYLSVMNYAFINGIPLSFRLDYSHEQLPKLIELNGLDETVSLSATSTDFTYYFCADPKDGHLSSGNFAALAGSINWDCDRDQTRSVQTTADVNGDELYGDLVGYNDWANLKFDFQKTSDFEEGVHQSTETSAAELTHAEFEASPSAVRAVLQRLYLPLLASTESTLPTDGPDWVVSAITVTAQAVEVVIQNIGTQPVLASSEFWVDLYISPTLRPSGVNQTWQINRAEGGLVWGITRNMLPIAAGQALTLRVNDRAFAAAESRIPGEIISGTLIYAQVDSANTNTSYGGVHELQEQRGDPYNNISLIRLTQSISTSQWVTNSLVTGASTAVQTARP